MRILERCAMLIETTAVLGPVNVVAWLFAAGLSGLLFGYRLFSQGYCRCFLSSR
jgi:hypothetical protein